MVCIEKRPYTLYGRLAALHFRYLTCLLDRGHIKMRLFFMWVKSFSGQNCKKICIISYNKVVY